jgi:hypothetical protein
MWSKYRYNNTSQSIDWIYRSISTKLLRLDAKYQRSVVWTSEARSILVGSLFEGYPVPNIIISIREDGVYVCIDGKQRCTAIFEVLSGIIPMIIPDTNTAYFWDEISNEIIYKKYECVLMDNLMKTQLSGQVHIDVRIYTDLVKDDELDFFSRLQRGMPLIISEKCLAVDHPLVDKSKEIEAKYQIGKSLRLKRGRAELLIINMLLVISGFKDSLARDADTEEILREPLTMISSKTYEKLYAILDKLFLMVDKVDYRVRTIKGKKMSVICFKVFFQVIKTLYGRSDKKMITRYNEEFNFISPANINGGGLRKVENRLRKL